MNEHRDRQIALARQQWLRVRDVGRDHPRVAAYLSARGIDVGLLPGGRLPGVLRYDDACWDAREKTETGWVERRGPAMVAPVADVGGELVGVHRTFLDPDGAAAKRPPGPWGEPKKMLGACRGRMIRLYSEYPRGVLVIAEGIETALACVQATGLAAWASGSSWAIGAAAVRSEGLSGLVRIPEALFWPAEKGGRGVHTVVFAADLNRGSLRADGQADLYQALLAVMPEYGERELAHLVGLPVGERMARLAGLELQRRYPWVTCVVSLPTAAVCPDLVCAIGEEGSRSAAPCTALERPRGRPSVDWLDVLIAHGPIGVRRGLVDGVDFAANAARAADWPFGDSAPDPKTPHPKAQDAGTRAGSPTMGEGGGGDRPPPWDPDRWEKRPIIEAAPLVRARRYLWDQARLDGHRRFGLARWGGEWWVYTDGRYVRVEEELLRSRVWDWLGRFAHYKTEKDRRDGRATRLVPGSKTVGEVLGAMAVDTAVLSSQMPAWLPPVLTERGEPIWGRASSLDHLAVGAQSASAGPDLRTKIVLMNGVLDISEVARTRKARLLPHTPDLFTSTCLPFELPVRELEQMLAGADAAEVYERLCPNWWRFLADASDGDPEWERQLQQMMGDTISNDRTIEKVYLVVGVQRGGKGTIQDAVVAIAGEENVHATTFDSLAGDRFGMAPLVGKSVAIMPDAHLSSWSQGSGAVEILKSVSGQDRVQVRDLYSPARTVRLNTRFWIFCNDEPDLRDDSAAFAHRLVVLPVRKSYLGREDPSIKGSVPREAAGIMLWALMGAIDLASKSHRRIDVCTGGREVREEIERESAHVAAFMGDCVVQAQHGSVSPEMLHQAYEWWCRDVAGREPLGLGKFRRKVRTHVEQLGGWSQPRQADGTRSRLLRGVDLRMDVRARLGGTSPAAAGPLPFDVP